MRPPEIHRAAEAERSRGDSACGDQVGGFRGQVRGRHGHDPERRASLREHRRQLETPVLVEAVDVTVTSIAATAAMNGFVEDMRCSCETPVGSVGSDDGDDLVNEPSGNAQAKAPRA